MRFALLAVTVAMLAMFVIAPIAAVVWGGLSWTWIVEALRHPLHQQAILNSLLIACGTSLIALLIALPLATVAARWRFRGQSIAEGLILAPLILPPFVGAIAIGSLFSRDGAVNALLASCGLGTVDWLGPTGMPWLICLINALGLYPILYLTLGTALAKLDPGQVEAARACGASPFTAWWRVTLSSDA